MGQVEDQCYHFAGYNRDMPLTAGRNTVEPNHSALTATRELGIFFLMYWFAAIAFVVNYAESITLGLYEHVLGGCAVHHMTVTP